MALARAALEGMIARMAADPHHDDEIAHLRAVVAEMGVATESGEAERLILLNEASTTPSTTIRAAATCSGSWSASGSTIHAPAIS